MDDPRQHRGPGAPACGRSRGGFGTEIPILVEALGDPVEFPRTAGQESDVTQAEPSITGHPGAVGAAAEGQGAGAVIPPEESRKIPRDYDEHRYQGREVARLINLIKQSRRVVTRYERTARDFPGFVHLASILVLLR